MDNKTSTEDLDKTSTQEAKSVQENILLDIVKDLCNDPKSKLSSKVMGKVNRIISDCDLSHYSSLHKLTTTDESTSTVLGFIKQTSTDLSFQEQAELNTAIVNKIQVKIPKFTTELNNLKQIVGNKKSRGEQIRELHVSLDEKLNILKEQENEKVELMMEWLNHRLQDVSTFSSDTSEMLTLKTRILELKSKILHLAILRNIFTETNQSIKAYSEVHKDLKDSIRETEQRIKNFKETYDKKKFY